MSLQLPKRPQESLAVFDPFSHTGLPPNDTLSSLPPLPDTPQPSRITSEGPVTAFFNRTTKSRHAHTRTISRDWLVDLQEEQEMDSGMKRSESQKSLGSPSKGPTLSTRQSSHNTPRNPSPTRSSPVKLDTPIKQPFAPVSHRPASSGISSSSPILPAQESRGQQLLSGAVIARLSASFQFPTAMPDASMIGDCAPPSMADESSFDMEFETWRPAPAISTGPTGEDGLDGHSTSPRRVGESEASMRSAITPRARAHATSQTTIWALAQSTLLPQSPALSKHLASSSNDLLRIDPPWAHDGTTENQLGSSTSPIPLVPPPVQPLVARAIPSSSSEGSTRRIFPASSSASSLNSVGEEVEFLQLPKTFDIGDKSTLLPISPAKFRHLMQDDMLQDEEFHELPSFRLPPPDFTKHTTPRKYETAREARSKKSTPVSKKTVRKDDFGDIADASLDMEALLAKMGKPKRASGTEESFADLLRGDDRPDELDMSVMGANDTFLPSSLRPSRHKRYTSSETGSPTKEILPTSCSTQSVSSASSRGRRRSKSLSELAQPPQAPPQISPIRSTVYSVVPRASTYASPEKPIPSRGGPRSNSLYASPDKPIPSRAVHPVYASPERPIPARAPATRVIATPSQVRPRPSIAPHTMGSKRISLSAGVLLLPKSASLKSIALPPPSSRTRGLPAEKPKERPVPDVPRRTSIFPKSEPAPLRSSTAKGTTTRVLAATVSPSAQSRPSSIMVKPQAERPAARIRVGSTPASSATSLLRPTHTTRIGAAPSSSSIMLPPASRPTRPVDLPPPSTATSGRPIPSQIARTFGVDATSTTNRLIRPSTGITSRLAKTSVGPLPSASKRSAEPTSTLAQHRAISTPASVVARAGVTCPEAGLAKTAAGVKKTLNLPGSSALPRRTTRLPAPPGTKISSGPTSSSTASGIASLRARLDQLQARQASARNAR